jgi:hypothetical protein
VLRRFEQRGLGLKKANEPEIDLEVVEETKSI